jgi:hypothetical protein
VDGGTLRCVALVDAGCSLLRRLSHAASPGIYQVGGDDIIRHALRKLSIDVVIVLSPHRQDHSEPLWQVTLFDRRERIPDGEYAGLERMVAQLPKPRFEGYQAREIHRHGGFAPGSNWYLGTTIKVIGGKVRIKLSARLVHEYLAGRIDADRFRQAAFQDGNYFESELLQGSWIRQVQFESGGIDEDDDYLIFELADDPGG